MLGLRLKLFLGTIGLFVLLVISTSITLYATSAYRAALQGLLQTNTQTLQAHSIVRARILQLAHAGEILLEHEKITDPDLERAIDADPHLNIDGLVSPQREHFIEFNHTLKSLAQALHRLQALPPAERQHSYATEFHPELVELARNVDRPIADTLSQVGYHTAVIDSLSRTSLVAIAILLLMSIAFAILYLKQLDTWLIVPLRALRTSAMAIESGNLDAMPLVDGTDEVGQLATAFNSMAARLRAFRKLDNARFIRTQETTQLAINSLPDAVAVFTPDGRIELANSTAEQFFQLIPGTQVADLAHGWLVRLLNRAMSSRQKFEPRGYESLVQVFHKNNEYFFLPHIIPLIDGEETPIGITLVLVDATQLRQIDEAKSDLINTIAHDLKTPLTSMQMALHLLREDLGSTLKPGQLDLFITACDEADRLHRLVNDFVEKSRNHSAGFSLDPESDTPERSLES